MWTRRREEKDDAYYDELIKQRIGEAIRSHMDDEKLDRAVLDAWIEEDNRKRAARRKRYMAVAACVLVLCIGTFGIKMILETEDTVAVAGKGDDVVNESGNNVVIKNNREDVEENIGGEEIVVKNWEKVKTVQAEYPDLIIPQYIPSNYTFNSLTVKKNPNLERYEFVFSNGNKNIEIREFVGGNSVTFFEYDRKYEIEGYTVQIKEDNGKSSYCVLDNTVISIIGEISDKEIVKIIKQMI